MDAALQALVEGVEAGKPGPPLRLLLPGGALRGTVIPIAVFLDKMELELAFSAPGLRRGVDYGGGATTLVPSRSTMKLRLPHYSSRSGLRLRLKLMR